ncbi:hypothetical protein H1R20_g9402, partial [Candolleomyces eurysporus]
MNPYPTTPSHYNSSQILYAASTPAHIHTRSPYSPRPPVLALRNSRNPNHTAGQSGAPATSMGGATFQGQIQHEIRVENVSKTRLLPQVPQEVILVNDRVHAGQVGVGEEGAGKENKPAASSGATTENVQGTKRGRAKGAGSKSGPANRRKAGNSDDEVAELTADQKKKASLKIPTSQDKVKEPESSKKLDDAQKLRIVRHVTSPEVWPSFKLKKQAVFNKLSSEFGLENADPIKRCWDAVWDKYKHAKALTEHTGGGDGDADRIPVITNTDSESGSESDSAEQLEPSEGGKKRKRGKTMVAGIKFSCELLESFMKTEIYNLINSVASSDTSVVRARIFSSVIDVSSDSDDDDEARDVEVSKPVQPTDEGGKNTKEIKVKGEPKKKKSRTLKKKDEASHPDFIRDAFRKVAEKNEVQLRIAQEREKREAEESLRKKHDLEINAAMNFIDSTDPGLKKIGQQMLKSILAKQGYEYDIGQA